MSYLTASEYYKKIFGTKVYKISLDAGCTCPTRDGSKGYGGCIFCNTSGSGDFSANKKLSIENQTECAKELVQKKLKGRANNSLGKYIAYFQNFSNTYGNPIDLEKKYLTAIQQKDIVGLSIATRPDCLNDDILSRIAKISKNKYVSIELGLQTSNNNTAKFINRCYPTSCYDEAIKKIKKANPDIHIVTHLIFGLPNETEKDMLSSVKHIVDLKTDGIKITVLNILENTELANLYKQKKFLCLNQEEYFKLLIKALKIIPPETVIHRLTGDGSKKDLIAPLWIANKRKVLNDWKLYYNTCSFS